MTKVYYLCTFLKTGCRKLGPRTVSLGVMSGSVRSRAVSRRHAARGSATKKHMLCPMLQHEVYSRTLRRPMQIGVRTAASMKRVRPGMQRGTSYARNGSHTVPAQFPHSSHYSSHTVPTCFFHINPRAPFIKIITLEGVLIAAHRTYAKTRGNCVGTVWELFCVGLVLRRYLQV